MHCAHQLWTEGEREPIAAIVYQANPTRAGGRCWTLRDYFGPGSVTEHGGSFIDSNHFAIRRLAALLGLQEEVVGGGDLPQGEEIYFIDGGYYTRAQATADWRSVGYRAFKEASRALRSRAGEERLDAMSVVQWLDSTEISSGSRLGKLMLANAVTENGGDPDDMSALDLIEITAPSPRTKLELLPGDNERFHLLGGNDQLVSRMISQLPAEAVQQDHTLVAVRENDDRTVTLSFDVGSQTLDVVADMVVLALPFSTLRNVDLSTSGLSASKQTVIQTLGMGSNAKLHVELRHKTWPALGFSGATYGEWDSYCCAWDDCRPAGAGWRARTAARLSRRPCRQHRSDRVGTRYSATRRRRLVSRRDRARLSGHERRVHTGRAYEDHRALDPWVQGAYSYYRVGQAATFGKIAGAPEGPIHFAGERTSIEHQGFLDGAVATGERAAAQLLKRIGRRA